MDTCVHRHSYLCLGEGSGVASLSVVIATYQTPITGRFAVTAHCGAIATHVTEGKR